MPVIIKISSILVVQSYRQWMYIARFCCPTRRVKLFYKVDGNFASKGVGFLFLKKIDDGGVQVLVRADNATSNIIFNVKAVAGQKVLRLAKGNNVLFFCVPNPPVDPKNPSPDVIQVLLRTGSEAEGEKLFQELKKVVEPES